MYGISLSQLRALMELRTEDAISRIQVIGGVDELCRYLHTNKTTGLTGEKDDLIQRRETYGANVIPKKKATPLWKLMWEAYQDVTLYILTASAILSFALGFYNPTDENGEKEGEDHPQWIEGVAIFVSIIVVILVGSVNDYRKEKQFRDLEKKIDEGHIFSVVRKGEVVQIPVAEIVVGDICLVNYGDQIPADGVIIQSNDLKIDESSLTGESDHMKKGEKEDPMLLAGTNVMEGSGRMLVTAVGVNSQSGIIFTLLRNPEEKKEEKNGEKKEKKKCCARNKKKKEEPSTVVVRGKDTPRSSIQSRRDSVGNYSRRSSLRFQAMPLAGRGSTEPDEDEGESDEARQRSKEKSVLQTKLNKLAIYIGYFGLAAAILIIVILMIRFSVETFHHKKSPWKMSYLSVYLGHFIIGITVLVVAVPEGLPLAVTISLAYSVKKMMKDNNLVRHLHACETMGNATSICSDKTGTLTTNRMTVVQAYVCAKHYRKLPHYDELPKNVSKIIVDGISINTAYTSNIEAPASPTELPKQLGNKTECALLGFVLHLEKDYAEVRSMMPESSFFKVYTFNSVRKSMSTVVPLHDGGYRLYTKGASEIILAKCSFNFDSSGHIIRFTDAMKTDQFENVIEVMASQGLRTISVAYKDFVTRSPEMNEVAFSSSIDWDDEESILSNLTSICIVGIEDPVRPEVPIAIMQCQSAGISVRMVTGDNINTARSIAMKCGILQPGSSDLILEGKEFNKLIRDSKGNVRQYKFDQVWPRLRVLARSSPTDKYILVKGIIASNTIHQKQVVAVTGDGTNDGPALKVADVGFAMGIAGTDVAKEACDIILLDDNFNSIVKAVMWGRNVYDSIAKFIQFQLTVNAVALTVAFVGACIIEVSPLKAVQMLWMNLIMDTLASLALATELPTQALLDRKPYGRDQSLISGMMWKNIIGQGIFQVTVVFFILFYGDKMMKITSGIGRDLHDPPTQHFTMVFNVFVMMTMFNEINARKIHGERNVFKGLFSNYIFIAIWLGSMVAQVIIIEFGSFAFQTTGLKWDQWLVCVAFGALTLIWTQLLCFFPFERMCEKPKECPPQIIAVPLEGMEEGKSQPPTSPPPETRSPQVQVVKERTSRRSLNKAKPESSRLQSIRENEAPLDPAKSEASRTKSIRENEAPLNTAKPEASRAQSIRANEAPLNTAKPEASRAQSIRENEAPVNTAKPEASRPQSIRPASSETYTRTSISSKSPSIKSKKSTLPSNDSSSNESFGTAKSTMDDVGGNDPKV